MGGSWLAQALDHLPRRGLCRVVLGGLADENEKLLEEAPHNTHGAAASGLHLLRFSPAAASVHMPVYTEPGCCFWTNTYYANYTRSGGPNHNDGYLFTYWDAGGPNFGAMKHGTHKLVPDSGRGMFAVPKNWEVGHERHCSPPFPNTCCHSVDRYFKVTGIPKDTPRVPADEERAILERWKGDWEIVFNEKLANKAPNIDDIHGKQHFGGQFFLAFKRAHFNGDMLKLSGGHHLMETREEADGPVDNRKAFHHPRRVRLSLWRGADGTLYIDNVGSKVVSESATELKVKHAGNGEWIFRRAGHIAQPAPAAMAMARDDCKPGGGGAGTPPQPMQQSVTEMEAMQVTPMPMVQPQMVQPQMGQEPAFPRKFDPETGQPLPKFDPETGMQNW